MVFSDTAYFQSLGDSCSDLLEASWQAACQLNPPFKNALSGPSIWTHCEHNLQPPFRAAQLRRHLSAACSINKHWKCFLEAAHGFYGWAQVLGASRGFLLQFKSRHPKHRWLNFLCSWETVAQWIRTLYTWLEGYWFNSQSDVTGGPWSKALNPTCLQECLTERFVVLDKSDC